MGTQLIKKNDCINLVIQDDLGFCIWQSLRDAREAAKEARLPLHIDVSQCTHGDMSGIGSLLLAQDKIKDVSLIGCTQKLGEIFKAYGICKQCRGDRTQCPEASALAH